MTAPIPQVDIEREIRRLSDLLETATQKVAKRAREAAEADAAYKVAFAKAYLRADGPVAEREATATVQCEKELHERKATEAVLLSAREAGQNLRAQISALQSLAANHRYLLTQADVA